LRGQRGQTLILMVVSIMALMMVVGLAVDGGLAYYYTSRLNNAAQAAADAGTAAMYQDPEPPGPGESDNTGATLRKAQDRARAVAAMNGLPDGGKVTTQISYTPNPTQPGAPASMRVTLTYDYPVFFVKVLTKEPAITVRAEAEGHWPPGVP
jgi:Flp pilus assembly protein TadG